MTINTSFELSCRFKELVKTDLSYIFQEDIPAEQIEDIAKDKQPKSRDKVFTAVNTALTMLVSAIQEDKSLQQGLNIFKASYETQSKKMIEVEQAELQQQKELDSQNEKKKVGPPKKYQSKLPKRLYKPLCISTAAYSMARKNLPVEVVNLLHEHSTNFGDLDKESWYGMETFISDGTYIQLQDTVDIRKEYEVKGKEQSYPQALLQVMIRQGAGYVSDFALGNCQQSELRLIVPMIKKLKKNSLLLADALYNSYYHFCLMVLRRCHIIVPDKKGRSYTVMRQIAPNDEIVKIEKTQRPDYVSKEEWTSLPKKLLMRRISYAYPTKNGMEDAVLFTTILDENITAADIVAKYTMRWDIEISIRETKTLMDINVLRSKSREMLFKELVIALTAYNLVRKCISKSADKVGFSPQSSIVRECSAFGRPILLDKKGRVFFKQSPGRNGYANRQNQPASRPTSKRKTQTLSSNG